MALTRPGVFDPNTGQIQYDDSPAAAGLALAALARQQAQPATSAIDDNGNPSFVQPPQQAQPRIVQPSFLQAVNQTNPQTGMPVSPLQNPRLTKLGKLGAMLSLAVQGGLAGQAASEQAVIQSGGHRSGGVGTGFMSGFQLPFLRTAQQQQVEQGQIQNQLGRASLQPIPTPYGSMPAAQAVPLLREENERAWRLGMLGVNQQKNTINMTKAQAQAREHGLIVDENGIRPMSEDEILSDPTASQNQALKAAAIQSKQAQAALAQAHKDALMNPNNPTFRQKERQIQAQLAMAQQRLTIAQQGLGLREQEFGLRQGQAGEKVWQPAQASAERLQIMRQNYQDATQNHDQQAMLSLLSNHLGMTMGLQKGARLNQAIIAEAQQSRPWLQGIKAKFDKDGYLTGVTLSPEQMRQMVSLGEDRYRADVYSARSTTQSLGLDYEPSLPIDPDAPNPSGAVIPTRPARRNAQGPTGGGKEIHYKIVGGQLVPQ